MWRYSLVIDRGMHIGCNRNRISRHIRRSIIWGSGIKKNMWADLLRITIWYNIQLCSSWHWKRNRELGVWLVRVRGWNN